jgi:hypothetical protein
MSGERKLRWGRPKWSDNGEVETGKKITEQKKPSCPERGGKKFISEGREWRYTHERKKG